MEPIQTSPIPPAEEPAPVVEAAEPKLKLSIPASIIIAGFLVAIAVLVSGGMHSMPIPDNQAALTAGGQTTGATPAPVADIKDVSTAGEPFIGNPNAPVTIAYYSDYQCPFCKKFETENLPTLKADYVDTGKIKIVFKDFVFLGPDSQTAALFARAVWNLYPSQYFTWREAMFNAQGEENSGFDSRANIEKLTATIPGINQPKVSAAVDANKVAYETAIEADYAEGTKLGVQGTPSVIIGTDLIDGAYPLSSYTDALAKVLK